jgi:cytochrome c-type biogenesis protein CcmH/NrfG
MSDVEQLESRRAPAPPDPPGTARPAWRMTAVLVAVAVGVTLLVTLVAGPGRGHRQAARRDLASVTNQEMEQVIADNPTVVGMRLALVRRYLDAGDAAGAHRHAEIALSQDPPAPDREQAEKFLGWSTALLGQPKQGAALLEDSLRLDPTDLDSMWFLANVRLVGLDDPAGAIPLFEQLLASAPLAPGAGDDQRRAAVEQKLLAAKTRLAGAAGG